MNLCPRSRRLAPVVALALASSLALAGCSPSSPAPAPGEPSGSSSPVGATDPSEAPEPEPVAPAVKLSVPAANVKLDQFLTVTIDADADAIAAVRVQGVRQGEMGQAERKRVKLPGALEAASPGAVWTASEYLEPTTRYTAVVTFKDSELRLEASFTTQALPLSKQTYPALYPSSGTFGVGQPVVVRFDLPVTDQASFERRMKVTTVPAQPGSWHWISATEARYRPKTYWKPGTRVSVDADLNSVPAGKGVFGQFGAEGSFRITGDTRVVRVNLATKQLRAFKNGKLVRTIPISAGKPGFTTRSGVKVIMSKHRYYDMNSSSIGIDPSSAEGYDLENVEYAMRLTNSGEFIHASPWNAGLWGRVHASHGCTGSSLEDTAWLFNFVEIGDPVEYVGSDYMMTLDNGFGDWNAKFAEYKKGSAL